MSLRILHLLNHTNRLNGHVHAAIDLAAAQRDLGHVTMIASGGGDFDALMARAGIETARIDHARRTRVLAGSALALRRLVRDWRPDLVHAHMMTSAVLAWPVCRLAGLPLVTTVHNSFERSAILMGLGTRAIGVSAAVTAAMVGRGIPRGRIETVLNGTIGSVRFRGRDRDVAALPWPTILSVAGLHPRKGLPYLLDAFAIAHARFPEARLCLVGEGPYEAAYRAQAAALPCAGAITFAGGQDDPSPWMRGAAIFVLPSLDEPAGLVLSEAREAGCAVIASRVGGIPEMLEGGRAGRLVPPGDAAALAAALCGLLGDPARLAQARADSQIGIERMRLERVARETLAVYGRALRRKIPVPKIAEQDP
ncbi:glycosyltransferase family 4 protein [Frigidibacter sp. MR17.24]|uniref:glycosyltransferase family 4 protein n=1 Tax=Frigidibacter sp. MR17.24 TaxID=3127345 RepID=UPI003012FD18